MRGPVCADWRFSRFSSRPRAPKPKIRPDGRWPILPAAAAPVAGARCAAAPSQRTEVAAAAAGSRIVVTGGYRADGATVSTVEILDTPTGGWEPGPPLPVPVNHAMSVAIDNRIYVFGGNLSSNRPTDAAFVASLGDK